MVERKEVFKVPTIKLNNGVEFPVCGLGTFLLKDQSKMTELIRDALDAGYRHFDTAVAYENHALMGEALKTIFAEGKYTRQDIFITTKMIPRKDWNAYDMLEKSLKDL